MEIIVAIILTALAFIIGAIGALNVVFEDYGRGHGLTAKYTYEYKDADRKDKNDDKDGNRE